MKDLVIKHKIHIVIRKALGVLTFLAGTFWILAHFDAMKAFDWIYGGFFIFVGTAYFITGFGSDQSCIIPFGESLKIRWVTWLRPVIIRDSEVENIVLTRLHVLINRKGMKPVKLKIDFFERDQKREVFVYIEKYCEAKTIHLIKQFNS